MGIRAFLCAVPLAWLATGPAALADEAIYFNDFDGGETFGAGISGGFLGAGSEVSSQGYATLVPHFSNDFLRNIEPGNPAPASTLLLAGLAPNALVVVQVSLAIIDSWDGASFPPAPAQAPDLFNVAINGVSELSASFTNLSAFGATQSFAGPALAHEVQLGFESGDSRLDSAYVLALVGNADGSGALVVDFFASGSGWHLGAGAEEETWALDNVRVVPEPSMATLLAAGAAAVLALDERRRRA